MDNRCELSKKDLADPEEVQEAVALHQDDFPPQAGFETFPPRKCKSGGGKGSFSCKKILCTQFIILRGKYKGILETQLENMADVSVFSLKCINIVEYSDKAFQRLSEAVALVLGWIQQHTSVCLFNRSGKDLCIPLANVELLEGGRQFLHAHIAIRTPLALPKLPLILFAGHLLNQFAQC